jgi:hypothetical protein
MPRHPAGQDEVLHDGKHLLQTRDLIRSIVEQVEVLVRRPAAAKTDEVKKQPDPIGAAARRQQVRGDDLDDGAFLGYAIDSFTALADYEAKQR